MKKYIFPNLTERKKIGENLDDKAYEERGIADCWLRNTKLCLSPAIKLYKKDNQYMLVNALSLNILKGDKSLEKIIEIFKKNPEITNDDLIFNGFSTSQISLLYENSFIYKKNESPLNAVKSCIHEECIKQTHSFSKFHIFLDNSMEILWQNQNAKENVFLSNKNIELGVELFTKLNKNGQFILYGNDSYSWENIFKTINLLRKNTNPKITLLIPSQSITKDKAKWLFDNKISISTVIGPYKSIKETGGTGFVILNKQYQGNCELVLSTYECPEKELREQINLIKEIFQVKFLRLNILKNNNSNPCITAGLYYNIFNYCHNLKIRENKIWAIMQNFVNSSYSAFNLKNINLQLVLNPTGEIGFGRIETINSKEILGEINDFKNPDNIFNNKLYKKWLNKFNVLNNCIGCEAIAICKGYAIDLDNHKEYNCSIFKKITEILINKFF